MVSLRLLVVIFRLMIRLLGWLIRLIMLFFLAGVRLWRRRLWCWCRLGIRVRAFRLRMRLGVWRILLIIFSLGVMGRLRRRCGRMACVRRCRLCWLVLSRTLLFREGLCLGRRLCRMGCRLRAGFGRMVVILFMLVGSLLVIFWLLICGCRLSRRRLLVCWL